MTKISPTLHIYSQPYEHADAQIAGNRTALFKLAQAIITAVLEDRGTTTGAGDDCVFASDGEGYEVKVHVLPDAVLAQVPGGYHMDPEWAKYPPYYCDRGYDDDAHKEAR